MPGKPAGTLLQLAAFATDPAGGNPAGVWLGDVLPPDASFEIVQGVEMGRPNRLTVSIEAGEAGVRVSGNAVPI
jgi:predicted PhzF superfamily epimerase YddE/YHI9